MRIAFQNVHSTNCVRSQEAESHQTQSEQEDAPGVLLLVLARETEENGSDQGANCREDEIQELILWDALPALLGNVVCSPVCKVSCQDANENSSNQERDQT